MVTITISDIRTKGASGISDDQTSMLIVNSKPKSAIVPYDQYEMLMEAMQDLQDRIAIENRKDDEVITADEVEEELGV